MDAQHYRDLVRRHFVELDDAIVAISRAHPELLAQDVRPQLKVWVDQIDHVLAHRQAIHGVSTRCPHCGRQLEPNGECRIGCM